MRPCKAEREWDWLDKPPAIRQLKKNNKRILWITRQEAERLCAELPAHLAAMVRFSLATGLRESNVTGLEWNQIDLQRKVCLIHPDQSEESDWYSINCGCDRGDPPADWPT